MRGERAKRAAAEAPYRNARDPARADERGCGTGPWARLIRKVYKADPLACPKCQKPMRVIALIGDPAIVRRILEHLGRWEPLPNERGPPEPDWPTGAVIPLTYHPVPDIA